MGRLVVLCALAQPAWADIYTWVDASGSTNVSNVAPPADAQLVRVTTAPPAPTRDMQREAELRLLAERVRELENAASAASQRPPVPTLAELAPPVTTIVVPVVSSFAAYGATQAPACDSMYDACASAVAPILAPGFFVIGSTVSAPYRPATTAGPVRWPAGNVAALGPWADRALRPTRWHARAPRP
ncbi:MAG: DUF4124 domain-containing protein [Pseudomonadota bacterium]|nr:DUF4124 domain-containing protein [Pseudomonadota bacterium]